MIDDDETVGPVIDDPVSWDSDWTERCDWAQEMADEHSIRISLAKMYRYLEDFRKEISKLDTRLHNYEIRLTKLEKKLEKLPAIEEWDDVD